MKPNGNSQTNQYIIREQPTIYEDHIIIIAYPTYLLVTWNIIAATKILLENILGEKFEDLHIRVIIYKITKRQQMTDFPINNSTGVLRLSFIQSGAYYGEIVVSNSHNETITVKRSNTLHYVLDEKHKNKEYHWFQLNEDQPLWLHTFSGYTVYE